MSEQNKIEQIKARATEKMMQIRHMNWSLDDELLNDINWLIGQVERKDKALNEIELILTDDTSTKAIDINLTINRAREAL